VAAVCTQTAKTKIDWQVVIGNWQQAIAYLQIVPSSHPNYLVAQAKLTEYDRNLAYAQKKAEETSR
jgi:hypothetical protein